MGAQEGSSHAQVLRPPFSSRSLLPPPRWLRELVGEGNQRRLWEDVKSGHSSPAAAQWGPPSGPGLRPSSLRSVNSSAQAHQRALRRGLLHERQLALPPGISFLSPFAASGCPVALSPTAPALSHQGSSGCH